MDTPPPEIEIKLDGSRKPKGKYLYAPGRSSLAYFPSDASPEMLADVTIPIWITEGPLKTLSLSAEKPPGLPLGINGVWGFRGTIGKDVDADGASVPIKGVISDFSRITWQGRRVVIIFDADLDINPPFMLRGAN